jgi:hypothetical protein
MLGSYICIHTTIEQSFWEFFSEMFLGFSIGTEKHPPILSRKASLQGPTLAQNGVYPLAN